GPIPGRLRDDLPSSLDAAASWRAQRAVLFRATGPGGEHLEATERDQLPFRPPWRGLSALACARGIRTPRAHPYPGRRNAGRDALFRDCAHGGTRRRWLAPAEKAVRDRPGMRAVAGARA